MCIKNLPQVLVIQLKRFDYDWERYENFDNIIFNCDLSFREMAVKFNDYFEFPKEFDLQPYTAAGLAKIEGKKNCCKEFYVAGYSLTHTQVKKYLTQLKTRKMTKRKRCHLNI